MTTIEGRFTEERVAVGETELFLLKSGTGHPMLVLHGIEGHEGWLDFHQALAEKATVYAPSHPGYGHTQCPEWISEIRHQAVFYQWFLQTAGIEFVDLVGIGMGGWIAAEMAVMCTDRLRHLILVDPAGIKPQEGEILDVFLELWKDVIARSFHDPAQSSEYKRLYGEGIAEYGGVREASRTMSMKMCFKPFMYNPSLRDMLGKVRASTLIVWGEDDQIIPIECGHLYQEAIAQSELKTIPDCGHWAHLDQPQKLADIVLDRVSR